jgi:hypothetical protein
MSVQRDRTVGAIERGYAVSAAGGAGSSPRSRSTPTICDHEEAEGGDARSEDREHDHADVEACSD